MNTEQKAVCLKYKLAFLATSEDVVVGVADNVFLGLQPINGLRHNPEKGTSGWFVWAGETYSEEPDFFKPMHAGHILETYPEIYKYLGLAPGGRFLIDTDKGYVDVWFDKKLVSEKS